MDDAEKIVAEESMRITDEMKIAIKGIADMYKEFLNNGLTPFEAVALVGVMLKQKGGGNAD